MVQGFESLEAMEEADRREQEEARQQSVVATQGKQGQLSLEAFLSVWDAPGFTDPTLEPSDFEALWLRRWAGR